MTGQHFKEIVESICMTKHVKKTVISRYLGISKVTLNKYEKFGVPIGKKAMVMSGIRNFMFDVV
jgi:DNA-binding transcriptional regulator YiaG